MRSELGVGNSLEQPICCCLPRAGGAAPDTELTPKALANMSDERFAEILNELQVRGDKAKLMQFVWSLTMRAGAFILSSDVPYHQLDEDERRDLGRRSNALKGGYLPPPPERRCPPRPEDDLCECCGEPARLQLDHCHTGAFRGWVCRACNAGTGIMDDVERLGKRIAFLRAHEKKIERLALIKAVHKSTKC
jgi:hypothetical protein